MNLDKFLKLDKSFQIHPYEFSKFTRMNLIFVKNLGFSMVCERSPIYIHGEGEARPCSTLVYRKWGPPHLFGRGAPAACSDVAGVMGWIDGWASRHNPLRSLSGLEGIMIRCVGAALRGDGNLARGSRYTHCL